MFVAGLVFSVTLIFVIWQPRGLQIGTTALIGAVCALVLGVVSFTDVLTVTRIVWDATLAFIGIIILSMVLDEIGFFEWCAIHMAKLSRGNGHIMFVYSLLLGSLVSAWFANDGAALILTPILLAKMRILELKPKTIVAFLLAGGFISDSASLPFVFSNLTNIVTANYFHIGFAAYSATMAIPYIVSTVVSIAVLWIVLRKEIPLHVRTDLLKEPDSVLKNKTLFRFSWFFLALLLGGYFIGDAYRLPISLFALGGGLVFLLIASLMRTTDALRIIKTAPWQVVWFSIGLYIVVYGLKNAGLTEYLTFVLKALSAYGETVAVIATGFIAAVLSALMNNMPTVMIMDIALSDIPHTALAYANIIGCNLGPKMTPFGSLATLLWLYVLAQKGVKISFWQYSKFGLLVTPPVLLIVLLSLLFV
ncbi:MAG: arsenic transporter [Epsilonproteobacteria bacterium]|uniref:arsenic transporter n=1 Tax=Sulfurospirillum sp. hDNRA2 TaxID=3237298 RepID=UPI0020B8D25B|nr:arsenic transporter [Sulfurospirillum sp. DNRA8]MCP3652976.1 arsenic transporter [Sulfurospirillum sp. DNRA8]MCR1811827.1 arsenic transporter [Sulfurospirillum sp. DNRA8]NCB53564.1 arsenic transporter [Campylobacterota bacterium]